MPIRINQTMPVVHRLTEEDVFVMPESRASTQDIRELEIAVLNLMPNKEETEFQLLRLLSNTPLQVRPTFLRLDTHHYRHVSESYLSRFYHPFSEVQSRNFDGLIITGAPVETLPFEEVDYWEELSGLLDWTASHVTSTLHICWSAQAGLYHHYGIQKHPLPEKLSGIYRHTVTDTKARLTRGFNDVFYAPHSRYTGIRAVDVEAVPSLQVLASSDAAGVYLIEDAEKGRIFVTGHPEYRRDTLDQEYTRDVTRGLRPAIPVNYYEGNAPNRPPIFQWKAHAYLLFANWLNYAVYQETPYHLERIGQRK